jgi:hypothetical protein
MTLALPVDGLDADGVRLIWPDSPGFDELARELMDAQIVPNLKLERRRHQGAA